jgi:uncharacterized protein YdhG (YjbR/CyaY superfamily)
MKKYTDIDGYISNFPKETQAILKKIRATIRKVVPKAGEKISYGIPTFTMNGTYLVYFCGWKKHVSLYPATAPVPTSLGKKLAKYRASKGTYKFPLDKSIPYGLIRDFTKARVRDNIARFSRKK